MHGVLGRGQDSQIDHARPAALEENQCAEITITRHEDLLLPVSDAQ